MPIVEVRDGPILQIVFAHPPVNALSVTSGLVATLSEAIARGIEDSTIEAIVLSGRNGKFSAGADIADFEGPPERLNLLRELFNDIEGAAKPIVAAIEGVCLGGGLELAIAAHYRVAGASARFGFPEISLGLLPGAGGTQRTPRLTGAAAALDLMLSGRTIQPMRALEIGLVDLVVQGDPVVGAKDILRTRKWAVPRPSAALPVPQDLAASVDAARHKGALSEAGRRIVECVEYLGKGTFVEGISLEANLFSLLMMSDQSRALRHGFFGRRIVSRIPGMPKQEPRPIRTVTIVGGGLMGTGIAIALLNADLTVRLVESREDGRAKARETIDGAIEREVSKGRISREVAELRHAAISMTDDIESTGDAELFIEAVFEDRHVKEQVFAAIDRVAHPAAILASNTSTLDLNVLAGFTSRPDRMVGLHFFSPANVMRLLEVVRGDRTSNDTLASAMAFAKAIGKTGVVAGVCDGFIGNRIFEEYLRQAWFLLEEGALPQQIDRALEAFGLAMGPCRVMDLAGQDIGWSIRKRRAVEWPDRPYSKIPDLVCELGRFGQKTGAGFYLYRDGRTPEIDPAIERLIYAESARIGVTRRVVPDREIVERCLYAMVNEGARILDEGIAFRPIDIDIVYLDGYGFPPNLGGPMYLADQQGLSRALDAIRGFSTGRHGWAWQPAPLLIDLVRRGGTFGEMNRR